MTTLYLLFAHLVADFVLQPKGLLSWKFKNWKGTAFHGLVHFFVTLLLFIPYLPSWKVVGVLAAVCLTHFTIDIVKIFIEKNGRNYLLYFLLDQAAHVATIVAGGAFLNGLAPHLAAGSLAGRLYENVSIILGLSMLIFVTYTIEIIVYQLKRAGGSAKNFKPNYRSMVKRAILFAILYAAFMILV